jgi:predicted hydrocarbon binding protein
MALNNYKAIIERFWQLFHQEEFDRAVKVISDLLLSVMKRIYFEAKSEAADQAKSEFERFELIILENKSVDDGDLKQLTRLFQELSILDKTKGEVTERNLLKAYDLLQVINLCGESLRSGDSYALRVSALTTVLFSLALLNFKGWYEWSEGLGEGTETEDEQSWIEKVFKLNPETGEMIHPEDKSRNVSFKAATFGVMLGHICSESATRFIPNPTTEEHSYDMFTQMKSRLNSILEKAGYDAGINFGGALTEAYPDKKSRKERIDLWCSFDTDVGWGKFEDHLNIDEETGAADGKIVLHSNFLIVDRGADDFNICSLMKGYIKGVLQKLLNRQVQVRHEPTQGHCGQGSGEEKPCDFIVSTV